MENSKSNELKKWYLGLDVGTNSVGWAVTDPDYNILKCKGNATWGINLFDEASTAAERRTNRTSRRRLQRKKQRIAYLQEFLAPEIAKVDDKFYIRLKESALWAEDRTTDNHLFVGELNDKEYNRRYPTIHHLICELMEDDSYHDPRLVYMACSYILSHRGHFLIEVDENNVDNVTDFNSIYEDFVHWFDSCEVSRPWECNQIDFGNILKRKTSINTKKKAFYDLLFQGSKPTSSEEDIVSKETLIGFLCGGKIKLSALFNNEEYSELEKDSITASSDSFDDDLESLSTSINPEEFDLLTIMKKMYDWSVLIDILNGEKNISLAKVKTYEQHKEDLKCLKALIRKYAPDRYDLVFRKIGKEKNYASYSYNCKDLGKNKEIPSDYCMSKQDEFWKFLKGIVEPLREQIEEQDKEKYDEMMLRIEMNTFLPKQMTGSNRVIPYQLYYAELKKILENASKYLSSLNISDEYGSAKDKILSIMKFRIPYYVGPLNNHSEFAWIARKEEGKITPWNFKDKVDDDQSEENFIRRMTCKCSYLAGEDVLPKNSLLYSKFNVLNEINNINIDGQKISVEIKQDIFENLFMKKRRVTYKAIVDHLVSRGEMTNNQSLKGVDDTIKSSLTSYHDFLPFIRDKKLNERQVEEIINRITLTTDRERLERWLVSTFNLSKDDARRISRFHYAEFGRLSRKLLTETRDLDIETGEVRREENIIQMLWTTNENLMVLLSSKYGFTAHIDRENSEYNAQHPLSLDQQLKEMYISNSVKRPILRTIAIVDELRKLMGCDPQKVFIEMARGAREEQKNKRTKSRKDTIRELYAGYDKNEVAEILSKLEGYSDDQLRSEKLYLYFIQQGKCMYSGEPIDIEELGTKRYDVDHIWPQSKIKDDSLDNKVLVLSDLNGKKSDNYPINEEWRSRMYSTWKSLHDKSLMSDKKFERLIRNTRFTDEELADFINRQLVETRQSTKAIASVLSGKMPKTDIVYVKAGLASEFRQDNDIKKCRDVNDLHHAKDAYLNIVVGNAYDVKFTKSPMNFIKSGQQYNMKLEKMLSHDIERGGVMAWDSKNDVTLNRVLNTLQKNNIRFVRYSYCQKGALFDLMPVRKGNGQVPRKENLDINKYGGYNKQTFTGFYLVRYDDKKTSEVALVPVPLIIAPLLRTNEDIKAYCIENGYMNAEVLLNGRLIKTNSLWEIDGYRVTLSGKSSGDIWFRGAQQMVVDNKKEAYIKKLVKYKDKSVGKKELPKSTEHDGISLEENASLYDFFADKLTNTTYRTLMPTASDVLQKGRDTFLSLSIEQQVLALLNVMALFGCGDSQGKDLTLIGGVKSSGIQRMTMKLNRKRFKDIRLIDQSPTGLVERRTDNLLML